MNVEAPPASIGGGVRAAAWVLRVSVALSCIGYAAYALRFGSPVGEYLFTARGWSEAAMLTVETGGAWVLVVVAAAAICCINWPLLFAAAAWLLAWTLCRWHVGGEFGSELTPATDAARFAAPLALAVIWPWPRRVGKAGTTWAWWLLRVSLAATFAAHGVEALRLHPVFVDYLIAGGDNLLGLTIPQRAAERALYVIGAADIAAAGLLLCRRWRVVAGYMAAWGAVTALSRIVHSGSDSWPEVLMRTPHAGVALALLLYWRPPPTAALVPSGRRHGEAGDHGQPLASPTPPISGVSA